MFFVIYRQMSIDISHNEIERWEVNEGGRTMKAHIRYGDEVLAKCEHTKCQVMTEQSMFKEEDN